MIKNQERLRILIENQGFVPLSSTEEGSLRGGFSELTRGGTNNCNCNNLANDCMCNGNNCNCPPIATNKNCTCTDGAGNANNCDCNLISPTPEPTPTPTPTNAPGGFIGVGLSIWDF